MTRRAAFVAFLLVALGCLTASCAEASSICRNGDKVQACPTLTPQVRSYSVRDIGKDGVPKLTQAQLNTVRHILSELPRAVRGRIRFVFSGGDGYPKNNFYVVDPGNAPPNGIIKPGVVQTFRVLNGPCSLAYEPVQDFVFTMTGCGPFPQITG